jgi:hypothetical protein
MGVDATMFLNNIVDTERRVVDSIFFSKNRLFGAEVGLKYSLECEKGKRIVGICSCPALFGKSVDSNGSTEVEGDIGKSIGVLRGMQISDDYIFNELVRLRGEYLDHRKVANGFDEVRNRGMELVLYNHVSNGMEEYSRSLVF